MAHVRKRIRRVLDDMGFDNSFQIRHQEMHDGNLVVTINNWKPHRDAIRLKKYIQRCADDVSMDVEFQMMVHEAKRRTWKPGISRH